VELMHSARKIGHQVRRRPGSEHLAGVLVHMTVLFLLRPTQQCKTQRSVTIRSIF
jgi:hypothetical protein